MCIYTYICFRILLVSNWQIAYRNHPYCSLFESPVLVHTPCWFCCASLFPPGSCCTCMNFINSSRPSFTWTYAVHGVVQLCLLFSVSSSPNLLWQWKLILVGSLFAHIASVQLQALTSTSWLNSFLWPFFFFAPGISFDVFFSWYYCHVDSPFAVWFPCNTAGAVSLRFCSFLVRCTQQILLGSCLPCKRSTYIPSLMGCLRLCS